ncbi:cytochrome P450 [Rhodococcus coprophilus]|uniref:Cytochrome P450 n=1 Tax=Rhodococcus coprophilus TaxID=38310 RepID=A0A2X4XJW6_9NOCA|nr:cytochrome P450 [Rhodococcus coprophilus]MBM7459658.1 cytochrome P450 [Rhodococcus coprophilus]SQI36924.1 cytochrome P450 [Rhodococcus coprophilus]
MARTRAQAQNFPLAPAVPMPWISRIRALRELDTGPEKFRDAGGPVTLVHLGPPRWTPTIAIVTSPQGAHDVLGGSDGTFDKEMSVHVQARIWAGDNLFNLTYEPWMPRRRVLQPLFTKQHVALYADRMAEVAEAAATEWLETDRIDLDWATRRLTLRVLGRSLFGVDLSDRSEALGPHLTRVVQFIARRGLQPLQAPAWMPTPARHRYRTSMAVVADALEDAMAAARTGSENSAELIRRFFELTDPATGAAFTGQAIRQELFAFLFAGHDTTATTLTYGLWQLGRHQKMQDRVAEEAAAVGEMPLQAADVAKLPYTVQVIHEALRMCPPAATVARMAMRDVGVDGYRVPAGTNVVVGVYALHHDRALWDNPERFDPDRFDRNRLQLRSRWQYLPFGGGPRTCIGDHFAMLEATLALAGILRRVRVESVIDDFPVKTPFTLVAEGPVPARIHTRTAA